MKEIITSKNNPLVKNIVKLLNSSKHRNKNKLFVVEGLRLCRDAMLSNAEIKYLIYSDSAMQKYSRHINDIANCSELCYQVSDNVFLDMSDTISPQGVMCVCKMLDKNVDVDKIGNVGKLIVLEDIQDPSNMGTILRTAEALGIDAVILSSNCCDIYNPKVLRGSMGAVFRVNILMSDNIPSLIDKFNKLGFDTYATLPSFNAQHINKVKFSNKSISVIGNEANGITEQTIDRCSYKITVPMLGRAESLNASTAASIVMWEMIR